MRISASAPILLISLLLAGSAREKIAAQSPVGADAISDAHTHPVKFLRASDIAVWPQQDRYWPGNEVYVAQHLGEDGLLTADVVGNRGPRVDIDVWADHRAYEAGDEAKVSFQTGHAGGYVTVFQIDPEGLARVIYPATPGEDNYVRADQIVTIGDPSGTTGLRVAPATGTSLLLAVMSRDHFELAQFADDSAWRPAAISLESPTIDATGDRWGALYGELLGVVQQTTNSLFAAQVHSYSVVDPAAAHAQIFGPLLATDRVSVVHMNPQFVPVDSRSWFAVTTGGCEVGPGASEVPCCPVDVGACIGYLFHGIPYHADASACNSGSGGSPCAQTGMAETRKLFSTASSTTTGITHWHPPTIPNFAPHGRDPGGVALPGPSLREPAQLNAFHSGGSAPAARPVAGGGGFAPPGATGSASDLARRGESPGGSGRSSSGGSSSSGSYGGGSSSRGGGDRAEPASYGGGGGSSSRSEPASFGGGGGGGGGGAPASAGGGGGGGRSAPVSVGAGRPPER